MLWMEEHVTVTNKIGSALVIAASVGADAFPILLGQFITDLPMILIYMNLAVICGCTLLFLVANSITGRLQEKDVCRDEQMSHNEDKIVDMVVA